MNEREQQQEQPSKKRAGERSYASRDEEREYEYESRRLKAGHVRCGGGWWVRRKKIGGE